MFLARSRRRRGVSGSSIGTLAFVLPFLLAPAAARADHCGTRGVAGDVVEAPELAEVSAGAAGWRPLRVGTHLCVDDLIRLGLGQRGVVRLQGGAFVTVAESTTLRIERAAAGEGFLLRLAAGLISVFSRRPEALEVGTPFANAAVEGTEFVVAVESDRARVTVLEGRVRFDNPRGRLSLAAGSSAVARAGEAPVLELDVRPRDAVRWALYYPPVSPGLRDGPAAARARLEATPEAGRDAAWHVLRAELALAAGRPDEAAAAIDRALALDPGSGEALALRAVAAVARGENAAALADARRAVALRPEAAAPRLALSYAQQAAFDLDGARATLAEAAEVVPEDALVRARLAEVELARGDLRAAKRAAAEARRLAPDLPRTGLAEGFAALAALDTRAAKAAFAGVIAREPLNPQARLGQGLARVREGELAGGREDLELAVALDPGNALLRSYLGKAYLEERRDKLAGDELATAKGLDPNDPTPWFYDAIRKQRANRPVAALRDLEEAIGRNDRRGVYRSRLLLDADLAARGTSLARVYTDLGFEQLGVLEASRASRRDPASPSAHRFLADVYATRPRTEIARVSELLQSQLLDPSASRPLQPSLTVTDLATATGGGRPDLGLNEYTRLFERDGPSGSLAGLAGTDGLRGYEATAGATRAGLSLSAGRFHSEGGGFRRNNSFDNDLYSLFSHATLTPELSLQAQYLRRITSRGDLALDVESQEPGEERNRIAEHLGRVGFRWQPRPAAVLIGSWAVNHRRERVIGDEEPDSSLDEGLGSQAEMRLITAIGAVKLDVGGGFYRYDLRAETPDDEATFGEVIPNEDSDSHGEFGYFYGTLPVTGGLELTAGVGIDRFRQGRYELARSLPKLAIAWHPTRALTVRAAAFETLRRGTYNVATLEPVELAAYNQPFDDFVGGTARAIGAGLDYEAAAGRALGVSVFRRWLETPFFASLEEAPVLRQDWRENLVTLYGHAALGERWALSVEPALDRFERDRSASFFDDGFPRSVSTARLPLTLRRFGPGGWFAGLRTSVVRQNVEREDAAGTESSTDVFPLVDVFVGSRLANGAGELRIEALNLLDRDFDYIDDDFRTNEARSPPVRPDRVFLLRGVVNF